MHRALLVLALMAPLHALAIKVGDPLYVAGSGVKLLKDAKHTSKAVKELKSGEPVTWLGAAPTDPKYQQVESGGKKGFVETSQLTPSKPMVESSSPGREISAQSFADSGATTRDRDMGRSRWKAPSPQVAEAEAELMYLEAFNREKATPQALEAQRKALK
jgi:hypothetical protein